ncbi:MAG: methyltransferase domain-containing protein [Casimicrobiaceae bacterium]
MIRARIFAALLATTLTTAVVAQISTPEHGDSIYQPSSGQAGKDVVWVPTPDALVTRMLTATKTTKDDLVYDLGAGDGRIPIVAAKQFGARTVGIEYNPEMAELARRNVIRAGVENRASIITGDIFVEDFSKATVVTMYLLPDLNIKLRPTILKMRPGTRVTSHQFNMGDWEPDERFSVETREAYLWYVPADVAGVWTLRDEQGFESTLSLAQRYQKVGGTVTFGGKTQPLLGASLQGDRLALSFLDPENNLGSATFTVTGNSMNGQLNWSGRTIKATARKR